MNKNYSNYEKSSKRNSENRALRSCQKYSTLINLMRDAWVLKCSIFDKYFHVRWEKKYRLPGDSWRGKKRERPRTGELDPHTCFYDQEPISTHASWIWSTMLDKTCSATAALALLHSALWSQEWLQELNEVPSTERPLASLWITHFENRFNGWMYSSRQETRLSFLSSSTLRFPVRRLGCTAEES